MGRRGLRSDGASSPAITYLEQVARRMRAIQRDIPRLTAMAEQMAEPLLKGGNLFLEPVGRFWGSEFHCRAGGIMGLNRSSSMRWSRKDVVYFELPRPELRREQDESILRRLVRSRANLFAIGRPEDADGIAPASRFGGFTGCPARQRGWYRLPGLEPLVTTDLFERIARGWIAAGELVAACTRAGRMPMIYMSIWFEGANARNNEFLRKHGATKRRLAQLFHTDLGREKTRAYVPPLAAGYVGKSFLAGLERVRSSLVRQAPVLARAGRMLAEAKRSGHRISASAVGHCYPHALGLPENVDYPVHWVSPIASLIGAVPRTWRKGDAAIHLGYGPTHADEVQHLLRRGIRLIQTSPYGRPADLPDRKHHVWFDLPWRPGDGEVEVPGYSVRMIPGSSSAHTIGYFCLLCELAQQMGWV